jgi:hypothetical protein
MGCDILEINLIRERAGFVRCAANAVSSLTAFPLAP